MKGTLSALGQARADVARHRRRWKARQDQIDPHRLAFIDETWIRTNMAPLRGRGPKGQRLRGFAPHGRWRTPTFVGAVRCDRLTAPCVFDGPINGACLRACVKQLLVPTLRPGDIVVMDNLPAHKVSGIREMIEGAGALLLYLPPCSPDFNPVEMAFSQLKASLRKAAARTKEELDDVIATAIEKYPANQCANYFKACGYEPE